MEKERSDEVLEAGIPSSRRMHCFMRGMNVIGDGWGCGWG